MILYLQDLLHPLRPFNYIPLRKLSSPSSYFFHYSCHASPRFLSDPAAQESFQLRGVMRAHHKITRDHALRHTVTRHSIAVLSLNKRARRVFKCCIGMTTSSYHVNIYFAFTHDSALHTGTKNLHAGPPEQRVRKISCLNAEACAYCPNGNTTHELTSVCSNAWSAARALTSRLAAPRAARPAKIRKQPQEGTRV